MQAVDPKEVFSLRLGRGDSRCVFALAGRYVGVTEADYEWLTGQVVELANAHCRGRIVSVLEGGYNLRGGAVGSAFARRCATARAGAGAWGAVGCVCVPACLPAGVGWK